MIWGILSSLGITISTLIDAVLVGNFVGSNGLAVTSIATPVFLIYALFGITIGVGANVLIGRKLGADQNEEANKLFHMQILLGVVSGILIMLLSVSFQNKFCLFLGASGILEPYAKQYLTVVFFSAPIFVLYHILAVSVRTDGDPKLTAFASAAVIITNFSLDILFLKVLDWGIIGASASLCIAEILGTAVLLTHFFKKQALLHFRIRTWEFDAAAVGKMICNGFGVGSAYIFQAVVMLIFNTLLLSNKEGVIYVAVFSIIYTMSTVSYAVFDGAGNAVSTVVSILAGERDGDGMITVMRQGIKTAGIAGCLIAGVFFLRAEEIVAFFGIPEHDLMLASHALRIFSISILFTGINMVVTAFWQAIGRAGLAGIMSVMRNFIFMLIFGCVLISRYNIAGIGFTYICSELLCLAGGLLVSFIRGSRQHIVEMYPPTNRIFERYYTIQEESVAQIGEDLTQLCEKWDIGPRQACFINLIVEELLLNIIKFGLKDTVKCHYIDVKLLDNDGEYIIRIRDNVNTYNPFESGGDDIDVAVIGMIRKKVKYCNYQRKLVFNYLYLII